MKNNNNITILSILIAITAMMMTACGTAKKAVSLPDSTSTSQQTTPDGPRETIIATVGEWRTMQTGGNIKLGAGSSLSSAIQMRMIRNEAIFISIRPMLGIEAGKLIITADSLYAVDKVHKRYIAEKVSILTSGIPVTVSDVQDIFLGRPFIIGKGSLNNELAPEVTVSVNGSNLVLTPREPFMGYNYDFNFDKSSHITALNIAPKGSTTAAYQVKYNDVHTTQAGNIAHGISASASIEKKKVSFSLTYKNIDWNGNVKIDKEMPKGYSRMSAKDLFSMFSN